MNFVWWRGGRDGGGKGGGGSILGRKEGRGWLGWILYQMRAVWSRERKGLRTVACGYGIRLQASWSAEVRCSSLYTCTHRTHLQAA